jgi:hypothetical protein
MMGTLKEGQEYLLARMTILDDRLQRVERRLEVVLWLLGIATVVVSAIAVEVAKRILGL